MGSVSKVYFTKEITPENVVRLFDVDLMDAEGPDIEIPIKRNAKHLKSDIMGKNFLNYDSMLVLSHFKGHPMGGYGGALKQPSIGCASTAGKVNLAATDPVAIDRACIDLVMQSKDRGREHFLERVTSRNGEHTIDAACELGIGVKEYELIEV